jgi:uncharacterized membrane protein
VLLRALQVLVFTRDLLNNLSNYSLYRLNYIIPVAVTGGVLAMLLVAATLPWVVVNFQGHYSFTPLDVMRSYIDRSPTSVLDFQNGDFSSLVQNRYTYAALLTGIIFYVMSIVSIGISIPNNSLRKNFLGPAAAFAIIAVGAWIYGVETMKMQIIEDGKSGGTLAPLADGFIGSTIMTGIGPYLICAGGIGALVFSYLKDMPERRFIRQKVEDELTNHEENVPDMPSESAKKVILDEPEARKPTIANPTNINRIVYKSSGTAALLAFFGAIIGLPGIGHIYVGRIGRGLLILISGFILYILSWISVLGGFFGGLFGTAASRSSDLGLSIFQTGLGLGVFLWCAYIALLVWQIFNARSLAKRLNEQIQLTGKEPW